MNPLTACFMSHGYSGTPAAKTARANLPFWVWPDRTGTSTGINTSATIEYHAERSEWCIDNVGRCAVFMSPYQPLRRLADKTKPLGFRAAGMLCFCCDGVWAAVASRYMFADGAHAAAFRIVYG